MTKRGKWAFAEARRRGLRQGERRDGGRLRRRHEGRLRGHVAGHQDDPREAEDDATKAAQKTELRTGEMRRDRPSRLRVALPPRPSLLLAAVAGRGAAAVAPARPKEKCPVCGMFVARYPDWVAGVVFPDGAPASSTAPRTSSSSSTRASTARRQAPTSPGLRHRLLRAEAGRRARGLLRHRQRRPRPHGHRAGPLRAAGDAEEFKRDHRGQRLLRFDEVTRGVLKALDGGAWPTGSSSSCLACWRSSTVAACRSTAGGGAGRPAPAAMARRLGLTDLALFTEARYTRHLSQADPSPPSRTTRTRWSTSPPARSSPRPPR